MSHFYYFLSSGLSPQQTRKIGYIYSHGYGHALLKTRKLSPFNVVTICFELFSICVSLCLSHTVSISIFFLPLAHSPPSPVSWSLPVSASVFHTFLTFHAYLLTSFFNMLLFSLSYILSWFLPFSLPLFLFKSPTPEVPHLNRLSASLSSS